MPGCLSKRDGLWTTLIYANIVSYLLLALLLPFFGTNPYQVYDLKNNFFNIEKLNGPEELRSLLQQNRASNLYLLGLTDNSQPPGIYNAATEISLLRDLFHAGSLFETDLALYLAIIDETESLPNLSPDASRELEAFKGHLSHVILIRDAINNNDQNALANAYMMYGEWLPTTQYYAEAGLADYIGGAMIAFMNEQNSPLTPPPESMNDIFIIGNAYKEFPLRDPQAGLTAIEIKLGLTPPSPGWDFEQPAWSDDPDNSYFERLKPYFEYWIDAKLAIENNDWEELATIESDWTDWFEINREILFLDLDRYFSEPADIIEAMRNSADLE